MIFLSPSGCLRASLNALASIDCCDSKDNGMGRDGIADLEGFFGSSGCFWKTFNETVHLSSRILCATRVLNKTLHGYFILRVNSCAFRYPGRAASRRNVSTAARPDMGVAVSRVPKPRAFLTRSGDR